MSATKCARLEAVVRGHKCTLNRYGWTSSDPYLAVTLNSILAALPPPLIGLYEVAEEVFYRSGENATARIISYAAE